MRLTLDHHYSTAIALSLRKRKHDVVTAVENDWHALTDDELLDHCVEQQRALLTNNVSDFTTIARRRAAEGRSHYGLIFTSDSSMPRSRHTVGRFVAALDTVLTAHPTSDGFLDRVHWL